MTGEMKKEQGTGRAAGIAKLKADPDKYEAIMFQNDAGDDVKYSLFLRGTGLSAKPTGGLFTLIQASYKAFGPAKFTDTVSHTRVYATYAGQQYDPRRCMSYAMPFAACHPKSPGRYDLRRIGRGEGIVDLPGLKLFGDIDPADLVQGGVGNCWVSGHSGQRCLVMHPKFPAAEGSGRRRASLHACEAARVAHQCVRANASLFVARRCRRVCRAVDFGDGSACGV